MNLMSQPSAFEQEIGHMLERAGVAIMSTPSDLTRVDYIFLDNFGDRIAIEARGHFFQGEPRQLAQLAKAVGPIANNIRKLILVTPSAPDAKSIKAFADAFAGLPNDVEWLSFAELQEFLGLQKPLNRDQGTSHSSQREHRGRTVETAGKLTQDRSRPALAGPPDLARQLSRAAIHGLQESSKPAEAFLRIGERVPVVVVLSDIKNFSLLVKAAKPDDLNNAMAKYYRLARALAWSYGGVLDKFIGDAVLTIFNYPLSDEDAHVKAVRFASDLIEIGKPILGGLLNLINEAIDTGTRVGVSTGEVSVLNIGLRGLELSFVGDVINLAARLEHESDLNGSLIDNLTKGAISKRDDRFFRKLCLMKRELSHERVKGQLTSIQAWQVPSSVIPGISDLERDITVGL